MQVPWVLTGARLRLSLGSDGRSLLLFTDFGVRVAFDGVSRADIVAPRRLRHGSLWPLW